MYAQTEIQLSEKSRDNDTLFWELLNWAASLEEEIEKKEQSEFKQRFGMY